MILTWRRASENVDCYTYCKWVSVIKNENLPLERVAKFADIFHN